MDGFDSLAISNIWRTRRSDSPCHLDTRSEEDMAKNVLSASVATALARNDLPVPGGTVETAASEVWEVWGGGSYILSR